ncbi:hypothetical protein OIE66_40545 [Nonomuraea sp. NBC_01738]|uniref:hypothetical protein n=1 Tax=Nonomuraea sp. NBC_01738 TaxID=2976003 RepID=UPI002E0D6C4A|nr:hypothetical protein OIE66_40545 [Nonomuraea sp. NBC_01738]
MTITHAYAATVTKSERDAAGDLIVYGKATGPDVDLDAQICDPAWLKQAMPAWMTWGNLREMHQPIAAGIGIELAASGDDWMLKSKVVDDGTAKKIEAGALKGYSVGIKDAKVVKDASAPGGRIVGGTIVEVSYVDRPCNPTATMMVAKAAGSESLAPVDAAGEPLLLLTEDPGVTKLAAEVAELSTLFKSFLASGAGKAGESGEGGGTGAGAAARPAPSQGKTELGELVKAAVAEATKPLEESLKTAEEAVKGLEADLAKVKAQPIPGGPVISRTATAPAQAEQPKSAGYYRAMADQVQDPAARQGYLTKAAEAERAGH